MKRRLLALFLAVLTVMALPPTVALAQEDEFRISGTVLERYKGSDSVVTVPDGVTEIGSNAFYGNQNITKVIIPEGVTHIRTGAFQDCTALVEVSLPSTLVEIGKRAFISCTQLASVSLPHGFTTLGSGAFRECTALSSVVLPDTLTTIDEYCFTGCASLTSITVPGSVQQMDQAFRDCDGLTTLVVSEGVTAIGSSAFSSCGNLLHVSLPSTLKSLEQAAFMNCDALEVIVIPEGVTFIGTQAFESCNSLKDAYVPGTVTELKGNPFYWSDVTIHGMAGSAAQEYAADRKKPFVADYYNFPKAWSNAHTWAEPELEKALDMGLIPTSLMKQDLTRPITRMEFAAVSVRAYESMSGKAAAPAAVNPFRDCNDTDVLKAIQVGVTNGTGDGTTFEPNVSLNREQAATMLARVFKKVTMPGWTLATDGQFPLSYTKPSPFRDDAAISSWAKDFVYFMAANGIIQGSDGNFMPKAVDSAQAAIGYAQATREQALLIAVRMVEKLG